MEYHEEQKQRESGEDRVPGVSGELGLGRNVIRVGEERKRKKREMGARTGLHGVSGELGLGRKVPSPPTRHGYLGKKDGKINGTSPKEPFCKA